MKKFSKTLVAALLAVVTVVSTGCKDNGRDASFKISGFDISGVKYLALGSHGGNTKDENMSTQSMLYSIDDEGNMQLVAYEYDCDEEGLVTELSRNITISITQMMPVGNKYICLVGCRYVCEDYSGFSESMQDRIRGMVNHSMEGGGENFLIRKSDGKIYDLNEVVGAFPIRGCDFPGYGFVCVVCNGWDPLGGDISADRLRKLGLINQIGEDIYLTCGHWQGGLSKLKDNGNTLSMINVFPANFAYAVTDTAGHLGTVISYSSNFPTQAAILAPDGTLPAVEGLPDGRPEMRCIGGKIFVSVHCDYEQDSIYRVDINGSQSTGTFVANGMFGDYSEYDVNGYYVSDEENLSWTSGTTLYTFNANTYQLTESSLPAGWPNYSEFDAEGLYYAANCNNRGMTSFTIYNLNTLQTEEVTCDRSQVPTTFNQYGRASYDSNMKAFIETYMMADASTQTFVTDVTGPQRGVARLASQTGANNNILVGTLIPL